MSIHRAPTILVAYPSEFTNNAKFERKIGNILSNLTEFHLVFFNDYNNFIANYILPDARLLSLPSRINEDQIEGITHAIIFDDGLSFGQLIKNLIESGVKLRKILTEVTRVANVDKNEKYDVYIGRGSKWGNPYAIGFDGDRDEVIRKFRYDFDRGFLRFSKADVLELKGKILGCHCKPASCHGDVLADYLNSLDD